MNWTYARLFCLVLFFTCITCAINRGQDELPQPAAKNPPPVSTDQISYALGMNFGTNLKRSGVDLDMEQVLDGIRDVLSGGEPQLSAEQLRTALSGFEQLAADAQKLRGERFLAENSKQPGVKTLPNGLQYKVIKSGDGATPAVSDRVQAHYRGSLVDGTEFDSSYSRGQAATLPVGGVIRGWMDALLRMKVGDHWQLFVPPELAYGERGFPPRIGPNAVLIFEIELLGIEPPQ